MTSDKIVRIANAQGFWGDSLLGPLRLVEEGPVDYLTFDYLAEITMSIMQKQKMKDPDAGYARDFVSMLGKILPTCKEKGIKVIANAGGVNPQACMAAIEQVMEKAGISGMTLAIVEGDDILDQLDDLVASGETFANLDNGEPTHRGDAQTHVLTLPFIRRTRTNFFFAIFHCYLYLRSYFFTKFLFHFILFSTGMVMLFFIRVNTLLLLLLLL